MRITTQYTATKICACDHYAPPKRVLGSPDYNTHDLPPFYAGRDLSGEATVKWILTQLYDCRSGKLFDLDGKEIAVDSEDVLEIARLDDMFGEDARRFITRYRARARARATKTSRNCLQTRLLFPVMMMHFAREIYLCRTSGVCSSI